MRRQLKKLLTARSKTNQMPLIAAIEELPDLPKRRQVILEDGRHFELDLEVLLQAGILPGRNVPEEDIAEAVERDQLREVEKAALGLLRRKDLSESGLRKLLVTDHTQRAVDTIIEKCREWGYLDDRRLAERLYRDSVNLKRLGPMRVRQELTKRGIPEEIRDEVCREQSEDMPPQVEQALAALKPKRRTYARLDKETAERRIMGFLQRRGFTFDIAREATRHFLEGVFEEE